MLEEQYSEPQIKACLFNNLPYFWLDSDGEPLLDLSKFKKEFSSHSKEEIVILSGIRKQRDPLTIMRAHPRVTVETIKAQEGDVLVYYPRTDDRDKVFELWKGLSCKKSPLYQLPAEILEVIYIMGRCDVPGCWYYASR